MSTKKINQSILISPTCCKRSHHYILTSQTDLSAHITTFASRRLIRVLTSLHSHSTDWSERSHHFILISQIYMHASLHSHFTGLFWALISLNTHNTVSMRVHITNTILRSLNMNIVSLLYEAVSDWGVWFVRENPVFKLYKISPALWKLRFFGVPKLIKPLFRVIWVKCAVLGCFST